VPAGTVTDTVASTIDILPTIAEITGAKLPAHPIDGVSVLGTLRDAKVPSPRARSGFFYYKNNRIEAVRLGKWKLRMGSARGKKQKKGKPAPVQKVELYDLDADIAESVNLAAKNPEMVTRLKKMAGDYDAKLKANARPLWRAGS
jgi:arylsulfatase A